MPATADEQGLLAELQAPTVYLPDDLYQCGKEISLLLDSFPLL